MFTRNILLSTDSYKLSHHLQFIPGAERLHYYVEARRDGIAPNSPTGGYIVPFGRQAYLKTFLAKPITRENIEEARDFYAGHGEPFNEEGWNHILNKHGGYMPLDIRAVAEGTVVPIRNAILTVENTDPAAFWLPGFIETSLLRGIWYPTTVATLSWQAKQVIRRYLNETSDDPEGQLPFKLHDFGARGVSSSESAALGGMAHLVNFMGSDTVEGIIAARRFYGAQMAGFSIPAAEHSTITSWGREGEADAYRNMIRAFGGKQGSLFAVVSDSYDLWHAIGNVWGGSLRDEVMWNGATLVVRPDSGNPPEVVLRAVEMLAERFGSTFNTKGFRVLNPCVRVIQGDGINLAMIGTILQVLKDKGWSADNVAFGMGGGLLQQVNRDSLGFAMKASAVQVGGEWRGIAKSPVDAPEKASKAGRLALVCEGGWSTRQLDGNHWRNALERVFLNGELLNETTFDEVRARSNQAPLPAIGS